MKFEVSMTHSISFIIEADNEDQAFDWLREHTIEEALKEIGHYVSDSQDEEIMFEVDEDEKEDISICK